MSMLAYRMFYPSEMRNALFIISPRGITIGKLGCPTLFCYLGGIKEY